MPTSLVAAWGRFGSVTQCTFTTDRSRTAPRQLLAERGGQLLAAERGGVQKAAALRGGVEGSEVPATAGPMRSGRSSDSSRCRNALT
mmetsp:Transcript_29155/g.67824  ORF Transcript_29155/g.67824 Transcript_29155/m.67824 type:complete len:87 (+) Transcript_29155:5-265(+)